MEVNFIFWYIYDKEISLKKFVRFEGVGFNGCVNMKVY